jgi:hypothetical protein
MENILHADIFFFVTTVAVIAISIVAIVALVYLILILRIVRRLMSHLEKNAVEFTRDMSGIRIDIREKIAQVSQMVTFFSAARVAARIASRIARFFEDKSREPRKGARRRRRDDDAEDEDFEPEPEPEPKPRSEPEPEKRND